MKKLKKKNKQEREPAISTTRAISEIFKKGQWIRTKHGTYDKELSLHYELDNGKKGIVKHGQWRIIVVKKKLTTTKEKK